MNQSAKTRSNVWKKATAAASALTCVWALIGQTAHAHDPALHGFQLKVFADSYSAPAFELDAMDGPSTSLRDLRGQHTLLNFWATSCDSCIEQLPSLEAMKQKYAESGLRVTTVLCDGSDKTAARSIIEEHALTMPVLLDADNAVATRYGAAKKPVTFLLDPSGRIVGYAVGKRDWASEEAYSTFDELLAQQ